MDVTKLHEQWVTEAYDEDGILSDFKVDYPDIYNFAYDCVDEIAAIEPDRKAMTWLNPEGEEHIFTFGDMKRWSDKTANFFAAQGIKRGDFVVVILRRHYQFWFTALALEKIGATMIPATFMLKEHDLSYRLKASHASAIVCTSIGDIADVADAVFPECPEVTVRILVDGGGGGMTTEPDPTLGEALSGPDGICARGIERERWVDFNTGVREAPEEWERRETSAADPFLLYFSSGTTGNPKMVAHNAGYTLGHIPTAKHWHNVSSDDGAAHLTIADTGWGKAVWGKLYGQWLCAANVFTYDFDRFSAAEFLDVIERYRITTFCAPPTMYRMMVAEGLEGHDLSSLFHCTTAGEALNPDLFESWKKATGLSMMEGFGQTETPLTVFTSTNMTPRPGAMGKPSPAYRVEIHDADGEQAPPGQTGEIVVNIEGGSPAGIMIGYHLNPQKTAEAMHGGWYHTGDTAWADEDGYYWYVGRNDDLIKSSGYRIGPFEIESVLLEHDAVGECAVIGVPDPDRGQAVLAAIVLAKGFEGTDELVKELQTWVKIRTAPYKYPRRIEFLDALPKTVNGKIRRTELRQRFS